MDLMNDIIVPPSLTAMLYAVDIDRHRNSLIRSVAMHRQQLYEHHHGTQNPIIFRRVIAVP